MIPIVSKGNKFRWKIDEFEKLSETIRYSETYCIKGTEWKIVSHTELVNDKTNFIVRLHYDSPNQNDENWICFVDFTITLLDQTGQCQKWCGSKTFCFQAAWLRSGLIFPENFEQYKKDGSVTVEIEFDSNYYDFSKNIAGYTDITLKVQDTEFYVNKGQLCSKSEYFYDLFVEQKSQETIFNIENVTASTFCYFVASFFPFFSTVYESIYAELIDLAKKYGVATLHSNCEQFLISYTKIGLVDKFKYAQDNGYSKLKKSCIESLNSAQQIKQLQNSAEFHKLDSFTKLDVMSRILDFV